MALLWQQHHQPHNNTNQLFNVFVPQFVHSCWEHNNWNMHANHNINWFVFLPQWIFSKFCGFVKNKSSSFKSFSIFKCAWVPTSLQHCHELCLRNLKLNLCRGKSVFVSKIPKKKKKNKGKSREIQQCWSKRNTTTTIKKKKTKERKHTKAKKENCRLDAILRTICMTLTRKLSTNNETLIDQINQVLQKPKLLPFLLLLPLLGESPLHLSLPKNTKTPLFCAQQQWCSQISPPKFFFLIWKQNNKTKKQIYVLCSKKQKKKTKTHTHKPSSSSTLLREREGKRQQ